jgi:hypothetical protein
MTASIVSFNYKGVIFKCDLSVSVLPDSSTYRAKVWRGDLLIGELSGESLRKDVAGEQWNEMNLTIFFQGVVEEAIRDRRGVAW